MLGGKGRVSILLENRDYQPGVQGSIAHVTGDAQLLNEVLFRLSVRRGSFPMDRSLGSQMWRLRGAKPSEWPALARQYAVQALEALEDVAVTDAHVTDQGDQLLIRVDLERQGQQFSVELEDGT